MLHLAISQFRPTKGAYAANLERIGAVLAEASALDVRPDLVVFPETATSGYFVEGGVKEVAVTAGTLLADLARVFPAGGAPLDVAIGFYERYQNHFFNSCLYATLGGKQPEVRHVHRKVFLPTYGVFDEERFVSRGSAIEAFDTSYGRAAILICEDACHSLATTVAALHGANILFIPSASPGRGLESAEPANVRMWRDIMRVTAAEHGIFIAYAGLLGFEGGKGFTGASRVVGPLGDLRAEAPFDEPAILRTKIRMEDIDAARAALPMLGDLEANLAELAAQLKPPAQR